MRPDFARVARQRLRPVSHDVRENRDIGRMRQKQRSLELDALDELPRRAPMHPQTCVRILGLQLGGQLNHYLRDQIGRPWSDVYSEVRAVLDARCGSHYGIIQEVRNLHREEGFAHVGVDPKSGRLVLRTRRCREPARIPDPTLHKLGPNVLALPFRGFWFAVHLAPLREPDGTAFDVYLHEQVTYERHGWPPGKETYARNNYYAIHKRQLSRTEIRAAGLPPIPPDAAAGGAR